MVNFVHHYVYIIQSQLDSTFYIGFSQDPARRLIKHNSNSKGYTNTKKPWSLVFVQQFETKTQAIKMEKKLKSWKDKTMIKDLINSPQNMVQSFI